MAVFSMKKRNTKLPAKKGKRMSTALAPRPKAPANAIAVYPDTDRYKFGFGVASASSGRIYKISFDAAPGSLCWKCSCPGCITHGDCKHLQACGLPGRKKGKQIAFAKQHGLLA